jgi:hypothetical protein
MIKQNSAMSNTLQRAAFRPQKETANRGDLLPLHNPVPNAKCNCRQTRNVVDVRHM